MASRLPSASAQTLIPGGQDAVILAYGRMTLNAIQALSCWSNADCPSA
ncbi:MAG: hypothetical protein ACLR4A_05385 [Christensenellales bacterium]